MSWLVSVVRSTYASTDPSDATDPGWTFAAVASSSSGSLAPSARAR